MCNAMFFVQYMELTIFRNQVVASMVVWPVPRGYLCTPLQSLDSFQYLT